MKNTNFFKSIPLLLFISLISCTQKSMEGTIISLPAEIPFAELQDGGILDNITFSGNIVMVELSNGKTVEAFATHEQMQLAFDGNNKATLEKDEDGMWKVIQLEGKEGELTTDD